MDVTNDGAANKDGGDREQVWVFVGVENVDLIELAIEILIDTMQYAFDHEVIFKFDDDGF